MIKFVADICSANLSRTILIQKIVILLIDQFVADICVAKFISHNPDSENSNIIN